MIIQFHKDLTKSYKKLSPKLKTKVDQKLRIFAQTPFSSELNNHALVGTLLGHRSINITEDCRAIYKESSADMVIFMKLGTHSQLY